jgi:hypothetical protein
MSNHSLIAPSSAARRIQCPASTTAEAAYPQIEDSPESADGTAAHWAAAQMLSGQLVDVGQVAPNGVFLTHEMVEAADLIYDDVSKELKPHGLVPHQGCVENPVTISRVHPQSWGTPDYYVWLPGFHLLLYDFKFGHRVVEVFENPQLIEYVAGVLDEVTSRGVSDMAIKVTVKIVQPRAHHRDGPVRSWSFVASDIRGLINRASNSAHTALGPSPVAHVGPECRDCRARHACTVLQRATMAACDVAGAAQPFDMPPVAMALEYRTLKHYLALMEARTAGLEEQLLAVAKRGAPVPGFRVEHGDGRQRWTIPDEAVISIGTVLGVNLAKPAEPLTPKQAVAAGLPEVALVGLVNTPTGAAKLVPDDGSLARRIFA